MEKLLELLNEYGNGSFELEIDDDTGELTGGIVDAHQDTFEVTSYYITMQIISKRFGFIERLVKNDKIAWRRFPDLWHELSVIDGIGEDVDIIKSFNDYEQLLMLLSIQDNPLDYLCKIIKE